MNLKSIKMDLNDVALLSGGKTAKSSTENSDFADFSYWNASSEIKQSAAMLGAKQTPISSKPKLKSGHIPTSSKLKKKKSVKKTTASRKKTVSPDLDSSREVFEDEPHDSPISSKPKKKKGSKKKSPKDSDSGEKSKGKQSKKNPGLETLISKSQAMLQVEGSVSSMRDDLNSDLNSDQDSSLTDSVLFSDSSLQLHDSDASSMFLDDPYAADSSEDDAAMLFLTIPEMKQKGFMSESMGVKGETKGNKVDERKKEAGKKETPSITQHVSKDLTKTTTAGTAVSVAAKPPPDMKASVVGEPSIGPGATKTLSQQQMEESITVSQVFAKTDLDESGATANETGAELGLVQSESTRSSSAKKKTERVKRIQHLHGSSELMNNERNGFIAEAEFQYFYPALCSCCSCCVNKAIKRRAFAHIYANRLEVNYPIGVYGCCSKEECVRDSVQVYFFDRPPFRTGMAPSPCCCCLCTTCGPPVMAATRPWCVCCTLECCDITPCFGEIIFSSPCNCNDCKEYYCCGPLCWWRYACPFIRGLKKADRFLAQLHAAVKDYKGSDVVTTQIEEDEMVLMYGADKRQVTANKMERS
jgi:hypothetical protein